MTVFGLFSAKTFSKLCQLPNIGHFAKCCFSDLCQGSEYDTEVKVLVCSIKENFLVCSVTETFTSTAITIFTSLKSYFPSTTLATTKSLDFEYFHNLIGFKHDHTVMLQ